HHQCLVHDVVEGETHLVGDGLSGDLVIEVDELHRQVGDVRQVQSGLFDGCWLSRDDGCGWRIGTLDQPGCHRCLALLEKNQTISPGEGRDSAERALRGTSSGSRNQLSRRDYQSVRMTLYSAEVPTVKSRAFTGPAGAGRSF